MRWVAVALGVFFALACVFVLGVWLLLGRLDQPWVKSKLVAACRDHLGLGVDYEGLQISLTEGVRARSLRLLTPPSLAAGAADFVRIEQLDLRAPLWRFALGQRQVQRLAIGRIELALVRDGSGRDTLSELFPRAAEPEPSEPFRPSQLLTQLPELNIDTLAVDAIAARHVELAAAGPRSVALGDLRASGAWHGQGGSLAGTTLALGADRLVLEQTDESGVRRAELTLSTELGAAGDSSLELRARLSLRSQNFVPPLSASGELLALDASVGFDAAAGKTSLAITPLRALSDAIAIDAHADLLDQTGLSAHGSGRVHVALASLPLGLPLVAFDALALDASARELTWDGTRIVGDIDASGRASGLELGDEASSVRFEDLTLLGLGNFEPSGGRFHATLGSTLARLSAGAQPGKQSGELRDASLIVSASAHESSGVQQLDGSALLTLDGARIADGAGGTLELSQARLRVGGRGPTPELVAQRVPHLDFELSAASVTHGGQGQRARLEKPSLTGTLEALVRDAGSATGVRGAGTLALHLPSLRTSDAGSRSTLVARKLELQAAFPLTLETLTGSLALDSLTAGERSLAGLALELEASAPLGWLEPERAAQATARGRLARFDAGGASGSLDDLRVLANRATPDDYRVELDARAASLRAAEQALPPIQATLRAQAAPNAGDVSLAAKLTGLRGGTLQLDTRANFDRARELLRYDLNLSARELEAFAEVAAGLDRRAAQLNLARAQLSASAHGELAGVLQTGEDGWPEPTPHPLGSARGQQSAKLELQGLDYRGPGRSLRIPRLVLGLDSTSGESGRGNASARLSVPELEYDGGGDSLHVTGLEQNTSASFERAPDQGVVEVNAALELASAAQSFVPGVPLRDVKLSSHVQIDRLRSIFLRELSLDNAASGSSLRAAGTLELLARASHESDATLVGREALFFEGRLAQRLDPFQKLGLASHASGSVEVPFRLESGGLLGYRLLGALEAKDVSWVSADGGFDVEGLEGVVPVVEEFALLDSGPVISAGPRTSPLSDTRFFDVHPFLAGHDYVTARSIRFGAMQPLGPIAANVRVERSDFLVDQLQAGYSGGQIVGQVRVAYRDNDPIVRMRLNATGVRSGKSREVFDANTALTFVPRAMTLDGKAQIVRASREHLEDILDVLDPFHESANANRVRQGLALGYPKFVRFALHDGAVDTKVELGGLAELVRIDEIKAVPLGPILQKYVAPALADYLKKQPPPPAAGAGKPSPELDDELGAGEPSARDERKERAEP